MFGFQKKLRILKSKVKQNNFLMFSCYMRNILKKIKHN